MELNEHFFLKKNHVWHARVRMWVSVHHECSHAHKDDGAFDLQIINMIINRRRGLRNTYPMNQRYNYLLT